MTSGELVGKKQPERHVFGPRPLGALLPGVTRASFRKHGAAMAALLADWPAIVGQKLAGIAWPCRVASGTLTLGCSGPVALELQHLAVPLMERINAHLGRAAVTRLRFVQQAGPNAPLAGPSLAGARVKATPVEITGVADEGLRAALAGLGASVKRDPASRQRRVIQLDGNAVG